MRASDEGLRWFVTLLALPFAGGVGWLVKHLLGRKTELVQLGLTEAQTEAQRAAVEEIRARVRREDEDSLVGNLRAVAQELRADVERLRHERDAERARAGAERERADKAEAENERLLREAKARHRRVNEVNAHRMRWKLLEAGVPWEEVRATPITPLYPEDEEEGEVGKGN